MKRILVLNFFPAFTPPSSGGELRYFSFYRHLSRYCNVTLLSPTYKHHPAELISHSETFREYRVPKEEIHDSLHIEIAKEQIGTEFSGLVCALSSYYPNGYHHHYNMLYPKAEIIVHDSPFMLGYDFFFGLDAKPRIYCSYNVEYELAKQMFRGERSEKYLTLIRDLEQRLVRGADLVFATSGEEQRTFTELYGVDIGRTRIAPNGIEPEEYSFQSASEAEEKTALFFGSAHPPNLEAARFIIEELAPACPDITFLIAGDCCTPFSGTQSGNVFLIGRVDDKTKLDLLSGAAVAINPMFVGAGTNLKTLEYLCSGLPLVSTDVGARGLGLADGVHYVRAAKHDFAEKLLSIFDDRVKRSELAARGRRLVRTKFSWEKIVGSAWDAIDALTKSKSRKTLFVLNDFGVTSPRGGGEVRINRLYSHLSKRYTVVLLCFNDTGLIKMDWLTEDFLQLSLPKTEEHLREEKRVDSQFLASSADIVASYMCVRNDLLRSTSANLCDIADAVIASHPYMIMLVADDKEKPVVYESLNFESGLKKSLLAGHPLCNTLLEQVHMVEKMACDKSILITVVSEEDRDALAAVAGEKEFAVVRNGVESKAEAFWGIRFESAKALFRSRPAIAFIGSAHLPNIEAARFIIDVLSPAMEDCYFLIVGSVCSGFTGLGRKNVLLFGVLDEEFKDAVLRISDLAINPVISGAGSNLKLAEYFASNLPVVTTPFGARGYDVEDGREAIFSELRDFRANLEKFLKDSRLREELRNNASAYVQRSLTWSALARGFDRSLKDHIFRRGKKKLLVLTYRLNVPPMGGAEVYLLNLLRELDKIGDFAIDVVAPDVGEIGHLFHFGATFTVDADCDVLLELSNVTVRKFAVDMGEKKIARRYAVMLYERWMKESAESSVRHLSKYCGPLLMGGWYHPEKVGNRYEIWSSPEALVFVGECNEVLLEGVNPWEQMLTITSGKGTILYEARTETYFRIAVEIEGEETICLRTPGKALGDDARTLGIRVYSMRCRKEHEWHELRLDYNYEQYLVGNYLDDYIRELINVADGRPDEYDGMFQSMRGPQSRELEEWLEENVQKYDIILGHSIPFNTTILATRYGKKFDKPVALLPHFHYDDRFYHWKSYYRALRDAALVFASPRLSIELFFDKIGARSVYLPAGISMPESAVAGIFSKFYEGGLPFFLLLGRKAGGKNYGWVIDAVRYVNRDRERCALVMIGRDEDGAELSHGDVLYLGEQPDNVVQAALAACTGLITMSESESFGIVILEAWAHGKPVIVNGRCGAFAELVIDGSDGLFASKETLAEKIEVLLNDEGVARRLGERGHAKVSADFSWEAVGKKANALLMDSVNGDFGGIHGRAVSLDTEAAILDIQRLHGGGVPHEDDFYFFRNLPAGHGLFLDVGANRGQSAVSFRIVDKTRPVLSFEPNRLFGPVLQHVKDCLIERFDYVLAGMGKEKGESTLIVPVVDGVPFFEECSLDINHFGKPWVIGRLQSYGRRISYREIKVEIVAADDVALEPEVIKIDAEGFELDVLEGMRHTIAQWHPFFLIENNDFERVTSFLRELGYEAFVYDSVRNRLRPPEVASNCFYFHREHHRNLLGAYAWQSP